MQHKKTLLIFLSLIIVLLIAFGISNNITAYLTLQDSDDANLQDNSPNTATGLQVEIIGIDGNPDDKAFGEFSYRNDGNLTIHFTVCHAKGRSLRADLYYSKTAGAFENLIAAGLELSKICNYLGTYNNCADGNFMEMTQCSYDWDISVDVADANYFIDVNVWSTTAQDANFAYDTTDNNFHILGCPVDGTTVDPPGVTYGPIVCNVDNDIANDGVLIIGGDGVTVDCAEMELYGTGSAGVYSAGKDNVKIKNCYIHDYTNGIHFYKT